MRHLLFTGFWTLAILTTSFWGAARVLEADPSDDMSFSLSHAAEVEVYRFMSAHQVAKVFEDHLQGHSKADSRRLANHLLSLCKRYRFDPAFILSLIQVESRFRSRVISPAGAIGLMQVMPATAQVVVRDWELRFKGKNVTQITEAELMDPYVNLAIGIAYLATLRDKYQGLSPYYLVAAYNVGPARLDQLMAKPGFKPVQTKKYYDAIRKGLPEFRFYRVDTPSK